jgi:hypothetical protein
MRLPVTLAVQRSRTLTASLVAAHALAGVGLSANGMPVVVLLLLMAALASTLAMAVRRRPIRTLVLKADGYLTVVDDDGRETQCEVDPSTTVFPWLIVLRARSTQGAVSLALPVDALGGEGHRQLRLWLKWKATVPA